MFKVGDVVRCVESAESVLSYGLVYRVVRISEYKGTPFVHVQRDGLSDESGGWFSRRFVLVKSKVVFKGNLK